MKSISFWKDTWCVEEALCLSFPSLFNLAAFKEARVENVWDSSREEGGWTPVFLRPLNDWELDEVTSFLQVLHRRKVQDQEDMLLLKDPKSDGFSMKIMYRLLDLTPSQDFPFRSIWNPFLFF